MKRFAIAAVSMSALFVGACDEKKVEAPNPAVPARSATSPSAVAVPGLAKAPPTAPSGPLQTIRGRVAFTGRPPVVAKVDSGSDPVCAKTSIDDETVVVNANKTLKNVLVRITSDITTILPPPPAEPLVIEQKGCMYRPRVAAVVAGQTLVVKNDDDTLHNVHTVRGSTTLFNVAQPGGAAPFERVLRDRLGLVKFKCDVHPWMVGYVWVSSHPYFAVTGSDGSFEIKKVPPGHYKLEAWHEQYGVKSVELTVADTTAEAQFAFDGSEK